MHPLGFAMSTTSSLALFMVSIGFESLATRSRLIAVLGYLQHDIDRAIIIDFDLHHGNGTQALVMPLNAASYADDIQVKAGKPPVIGQGGKRRRGWKAFYGSVHDIYSYPCEDGDLDLIRDASISLAAHGQYIENIHLKPYSSEADFYERIYPLYLALLDKARVFMEQTEADPGRTIVFISAGFDACEWEHQGMQRHDRRVPVSFYSRYTRDIAAFADKYTEGKVVSVLEGGYSDRALTSAAMGHIVGMRGSLPEGCDEWWTERELINLEKATKKKRGGKLAPLPAEFASQPHLSRTHSLLAHFEGITVPDAVGSTATNTPTGTTRMTLRDRKKADESGGASVDSTPGYGGAKKGKGRPVAAAGGTPATSKLKTVASQHIDTAITDDALGAQSSLEMGVSGEKEMGDWIEDAVKHMTKMSLGENASTPPVHESKSTSPSPPSIQTTPTTTALPKIILRIPVRPTTTDTAERPEPVLPSQSDQSPLDAETQARPPPSETVTYNPAVTPTELLHRFSGGH
ncbi:histone deacetylase HOS3 [Cryptococcus neoformans]|nr:histone deacetylase HOS3 [Cryptococcus neoformans var. grubii]